MLGPFDKPAELKIQPLPFELMFQMAEKRQQRADKAEENMSALTGAFASLQTAPGHEQYKVQALKPYQDALQGFMNKYSDMSDPRAIRELTNIKSSFANDPNIHNIVESKQTYDKFAPELYKAKNTGAVFTGSVFDKNGEIKQNTQRYTPDELSFIPQADINPEINTELGKVHEYFRKSNLKPSFVSVKGPNGETVPLLQQGTTTEQRKSYQEFNNAIEAITNNIMQGNTDASRFFIPKNWQGDVDKTREYVKSYVYNQAVPFFFKNESSDLNYSMTGLNKGDDLSIAPPTSLYRPYEQFTNESTSAELKNIYDPSTKVVNKGDNFVPVNIPSGQRRTYSNSNFDPVKTYESLSPLTRNKIEYLRKNDPKYQDLKNGTPVKDIKSFTKEDYKYFDDKIKEQYEDVKVSDLTKVFNDQEDKAWTGHLNRNITSYFYYDPNDKKVISGTELNNKGFKFESTSGVITNNTYINIPTNDKYKFTVGVPTIVIDADDNKKELIVGLNRAQLMEDPKLYNSALKNEINSAHKLQMPTSLFGSSITIIPEGKNYSFLLDLNDGTDPIPYIANTEEEYNDQINLIMNDSNIKTLLYKSLNQ